MKPRAQASEPSLRALVAAQGAKETSRAAAIGVRVLTLPTTSAARALAAFKASALIEYAEPDAPVHATTAPNDPWFCSGQQWHLTKIMAPAAWDLTQGSPDVIVAIVDSGVRATHPDLSGKILPGYDFVAQDDNPDDEFGHGTAVASIAAAATDNALGLAGVSWKTTILPVRVLDASGSGSYSTLIDGILFAADCGARVINLSLAGTSTSDALQAAIDYAWSKGALVVAAAGNSGSTAIAYPAACRNVIAVSATDASDQRPSWSSYGNWIDVTAPGVSLPIATLDGSYTTGSGTSFSAPVVSGVAALMAAANPSLSNVTLSDLLLTSTDDVGPAGFDSASGYGRVNASRAVQAARNRLVPDSIAPLPTFTTPDDGATVSGSLSIAGLATDNVGVTRLEALIDGAPLARADGASLSCTIDSRTLAEGEHTLKLLAYDDAGNCGSATRQIIVQNLLTPSDNTPPTVSLVRLNGAASGNVKLQVQASDNIGVVRVDLYVNGAWVDGRASSSALFEWKGAKAPKGSYTLQALAMDVAGNVGASNPIVLTR